MFKLLSKGKSANVLTANEKNIPHKFKQPERRSKEEISLNLWMVNDKTNN